MQESLLDERRLYAREAVEYAVQLQPINAPTIGGAGIHPCLTKDVSASGMAVWVERKLPLDSRLVITVEREDAGLTRITSQIGSVVWVSSVSSNDRFLLGIQFCEETG